MTASLIGRQFNPHALSENIKGLRNTARTYKKSLLVISHLLVTISGTLTQLHSNGDKHISHGE